MRRPLLLTAIFGVAYLLGLGTPGLFDYDEACYAEVARAMHARGEWLETTLNGEPFFEKPPLLYWSQILGYRLFGVGPFGARFFNALAAVGLVLAVYGFSRRPLGTRGALLAAVFLGTSLEFFALARTAFTDMFLALWFTLCLGCFHRAAETWRTAPAAGTGWFLAACSLAGLAMLTKGAVGAILPGATILLFALGQRRIGALLQPVRLATGLAILAAVGLSWYVLLGLTHAGGFGFLQELLWAHHVGRFTTPMQGHGGSILFYLPVLIGGFLPWSPFLLVALAGEGLARADGEARRYLLLMGLFAAVTLVFFSLAATKLPNYIAPVLPAAAMLVGQAFELRRRQPTRPPGRLWRVAVGFTVGILSLLALAFLMAPWLLEALPEWLGEKAAKRPGLAEPWALGAAPYLAAGVLLGTAAGAVVGFARRELALVAAALAGGMLCLFLVVVLLVVPRYDAQFAAPLHTLARKAAAAAQPHRPIVLLGIRHAPSVIFYGERSTRYVSPKRLDEIAQLFAGPEPEVGITVTAYTDLLRGPGRVEVLEGQKGYVLFRCWPGAGTGE
ncbi:MAG: glycosyltransferase family 39 protein [Planctomycetes bacterium]|nr:glycosyltransferase family 39 protein [Planctomycetota bacterium]